MEPRYSAKAIIVNSEGKVLMQDRRSISKWWETWWLFWWWIDFLEDPITWLQRELQEEINIHVDRDECIFLWYSHWHIRKSKTKWHKKIKLVVYVIKKDLEEKNIIVSEWDDAVYMTIDEILNIDWLFSAWKEAIMMYKESLENK